MMMIFGIAIGFVIGIAIGTSLNNDGRSNGRVYRDRYDINDDRVRRWMNDPVVRELNEQAKTKNLP
jgi:hypothetical protein